MNSSETSATRGKPSALHVNQISAPRLLVFGAIGLLLYVAHVAFIPIALALLFALVLSSPVEALHARRVPRGLSALVILAIALGLLVGAITVLWKPAQQWYVQAPQTIKLIKRKVAPAEKIVNRVDAISSSASVSGNNLQQGHPPASNTVTAPPAEQQSLAASIFSSTLGAGISVVTCVILTLFMLAGGPPMMARMTAAFVDDLNASHVLAIIESVRGEVARFYAVTAIVNVGLGCATTVVMMMWGMPTPYVWGIMAALLNFIPYAGAAATSTVIALVAVITFDSPGHILGVAGSYVLLAAIEGQVVQPLFVGRRLEINPLLIFLGLWLGGLYWGIAGILLATPMLVALKVIAKHAISGNSVLEFLGPNDQSEATETPLRKLARAAVAERKP